MPTKFERHQLSKGKEQINREDNEFDLTESTPQKSRETPVNKIEKKTVILPASFCKRFVM